MKKYFPTLKSVKGTLNLPGDKSISHRAVMIASLAKGKSIIYNYLNSNDVRSTIGSFQKLGSKIQIENSRLIIEGVGFKNFTKPEDFLDAGNSGTTARLLTGILSAQNFSTIIVGDSSLSKRPMERIVKPLNLMGANIQATNGSLPLKIEPSKNLHSIVYKLPIASAQVKSALLFLGLHLDETTEIIEPIPTRNHTELMLNLEVTRIANKNHIKVNNNYYPRAKEFLVPADISTAAFFIVLALLTTSSEIILKNVLLNKTRAGIIQILKKMGANIEVDNFNEKTEPMGDLIVRSSKLNNITIEKELVPNIIDEIPILSVAGLLAEGEFKIRNVEELRYKESDRIKAICNNLRMAGAEVIEYRDGFEIVHSKIKKKAFFESYHDHRIAMAFAVLSMLLKEGGTVNNFECVKISNPYFLKQLETIAK